jgi:hypothetical protein
MNASVEPSALGLIAGTGRFPLDVADAARRLGRRVFAIAFHSHTDPRIETRAAAVTWLHPGEVGAAIEALREAGIRDAVMAGKVPKTALHSGADALRLDAEAREILAGVPARGDGSILAALADHLERRGIRLLDQTSFVPELLALPGALGTCRPGPAQRADIAFAVPIARALAAFDVGQTVVVKDRCVLAVEAAEGTDAAIARAGSIASGACVVKVARCGQDPRFDLPAIGPETVHALAAARAAVLAFEAGRTVVLDRAESIRIADRHGIALLGLPSDPLAEEA